MNRWFLPSELIVRGNRLLRLYSYYSLFLALLLITVTALDDSNTIVGAVIPHWMQWTAVLYVVCTTLFSILASRNPDPQLAVSFVFLEIALLCTMMLASGGLNTGFASLVMIPVVIANLLAPGVLGYGVAAWTTLAVFYTQYVLGAHTDPQDMVSAGLYGFLAFILAWFTQSLAGRLNSTLALASEQATRIRRLQRFSQQALMDMPDGIIACDQQHRILFFNQRARLWFSLQEGQPLPALLRSNGGLRTVERDGEKLLLRKVELNGPEPGDYLLEIEDSARVAAEAQQFKLASLGRLTASIAHEIRNPLSALRQASQLLGETPYLQDSERHLTRIIEQQCLRINRTIEDILQLSRKRPSVAGPLLLAPWLASFCQQFRDLHTGTAFTFNWHCPADLSVRFDSGHLQQILHNLCANGLRYARRQAGDQARLTLVAQALTPHRVQLDVIDNGGGISSDFLNGLFEPFHTSEHSGTGLGLYICRELCEANQASIQYHPVPNGACFRLLLTVPEPTPIAGILHEQTDRTDH